MMMHAMYRKPYKQDLQDAEIDQVVCTFPESLHGQPSICRFGILMDTIVL